MQYGLTALHKAAESGNAVIVRHMIAAGCNQTIDTPDLVYSYAIQKILL